MLPQVLIVVAPDAKYIFGKVTGSCLKFKYLGSLELAEMYICSCNITNPGIIAFPFKSMLFASFGTMTLASSPSHSILPFLRITV